MSNFKELWPGWETTRLIGRGSFGAVYEIERKLFEDDEPEKAALKVISIPQNDSDIEELYNDGYDEESVTSTFHTHLKSIVAEYSLMRKMNGSSNVVNCDDVRYVQHDDGIGWDIYIKMELLTPLTKALPAAVSEVQVIKIAKDMCAALELCQKHNIIHRDIKPQNIFVSENGDYKLGDFGIAKTVEKTMGGTKTGTYKYMAPEVYSNKPYNSTADIYSLGLVLYWLLNERRMPFIPLPPEKLRAGMDEESRARRFSSEKIPAPKNGSEELKRIILKACDFDPKDRYQSAREMRDDLLHFSGGQAAEFIPEPKPTPILDVQDDTDDNKTVGPVFKHTPVANTDDSGKTVGPDFSPKKKNEKPKEMPWAAIVVVACIVLSVIYFLIQGGFKIGNKQVSAEKISDSHRIAAASYDSLLKLNNDGTVSFVGDNSLGIGDVDDWHDIQAIFSSGDNTVGIKNDGTVIWTSEYAGDDIASWDDIVDVSFGQSITYGLREDGSVVTSGYDEFAAAAVSNWSDIVDIASDAYHVLGVKEDGTVVANGSNEQGQCNVGSWKNVVAVEAEHGYSMALREDGTVLATGLNYVGQCDVQAWSNIVDIGAGSGFAVGLRSDGAIVIAGEFKDGTVKMHYDEAEWTDIVEISVGRASMAGLKSDGTIVWAGTAEDYNKLRSTIEEWNSIVKTEMTVQTTEGASLYNNTNEENIAYEFDDNGTLLYFDVTLFEPTCTLSEERVSFVNSVGGNAYNNYRILEKPVQNALSMQIDLTVTEVSSGKLDGTWRVHIRDMSTGKWRPMGYFEVEDGKGNFAIDFKDPISFDAYVCTRHSGGDYSGEVLEILTEVTYRVYS